MQQQEEPRGWRPVQDAKVATELFVFVCQVLSRQVEPFTRVGFGIRYFGVVSFLGMFTPILWGIFWPHHSPRGLLIFWVLYLVMQLRARINSRRAAKRGMIVHTRYNGYPWLCYIIRSASEERVKCHYEPLMVIVVGILIATIDGPLGSYLIASGVGLLVVNDLMRAIARAKALNLHDALIEQELLAERLRELRTKGYR